MKNIKAVAIFSLTTVFMAGAIVAADYQSADYKNAYTRYLMASTKGGTSSKQLVDDMENLVSIDGSDPLAYALLGSSQTLRGRDALLPWSKMKFTETGLNNLDQAVAKLTPEHDQHMFEGMPVGLRVKSLAGITFSQVPEFFDRHDKGYLLLADVLSDEAFLALPAEAQSFAFYYGVHAARNVGQDDQANAWLAHLAAMPANDEFVAAAKYGELR